MMSHWGQLEVMSRRDKQLQGTTVRHRLPEEELQHGNHKVCHSQPLQDTRDPHLIPRQRTKAIIGVDNDDSYTN